MQIASVTGVVGVSFIVTLFASAVNYIREEGIRTKTIMNAVEYGLAVVIISSIGMFQVEKTDNIRRSGQLFSVGVCSIFGACNSQRFCDNNSKE